MGWVLLTLRRSELQSSIADIEMDLLQISRKRNQLSLFSSSIADGHITPNEIASFGSELFGDALDFMGYSKEFAQEMATTQTDYYATAYEDVTQAQYFNNPALAAQAPLHFDPETGALNTDMMYSEFYEQALKEYVENHIKPQLNELEKEIQQEQTELETQLKAQEAELEVVKENISSNISSTTIQLS